MSVGSFGWSRYSHREPTRNRPLYDYVAILVSAGKLRVLGKLRSNGVKFFSSIELITLLADRDTLDEATKTIGLFWRRKNARRNGLTLKKQADAAPF
jgi:hypothetical protein